MARVLGMSWRRLHSPMLFLWGRALQGNQRHWPDGLQWSQHAKALAPIQDWHKELTQSSAPLKRVDLGAGRRRTGRKERTTTVGALARTSLTPWNEVASLCRWLLTIKSKGRWLELGTSLGTTSASVAALGWDVETWEGCPHTLDWAQRGWQELNVHASIQSKCGDFRTLVKDVPSEQSWDVVYVDGLHEEHATMDLIEALKCHVEVAVVLDDIAWSAGMHRAWKHLQDDPDWRVSFSWRGRGFLVKAPHMEPQRFRLA